MRNEWQNAVEIYWLLVWRSQKWWMAVRRRHTSWQLALHKNHNTKTWMQRWLFLFRHSACVFHIPYRNTPYTHSHTLSCTYKKAYNVTSITLYGSVFILCLCRNTFIRLHCLSQVMHSYNRAQIFRIEHLYVTNCSRLLLLLPPTLLLLLLLLFVVVCM